MQFFVAPKLHEVARPVYTGDFCRATQCNFCRAEVASSFEHVRNLMQLHGDKNCIELRDKNRLCKRAFTRDDFQLRFLIAAATCGNGMLHGKIFNAALPRGQLRQQIVRCCIKVSGEGVTRINSNKIRATIFPAFESLSSCRDEMLR